MRREVIDGLVKIIVDSNVWYISFQKNAKEGSKNINVLVIHFSTWISSLSL